MMIKNTTLVGKHITLEPMILAHADGLFVAAKEPQIWRYMIRPALSSLADSQGFILSALDDASDGSQIPLIIKLNRDDTVIGSTRYLDIQPRNRAIEVGWTFINPQYWGTSIGVEMKYLLFKEAFNSGFIRLLLKTDGRNHRAQRHIEKVGGVKEGVLRKHLLTGDGVQRDTVMYSILEDEWPAVQRKLIGLLG